jgi:hypothetical protein
MNDIMISKHDWKDCNGLWMLRSGKAYETSDCPSTYDTTTGRKSPVLVVVTCEDGQYRVRRRSDFMDMTEYRELRIDSLGI